MGRLATIGSVEIKVYANDHLPPHFHIIGSDFEALIVIQNFALYAGSLPKESKEALAWAKANAEVIAKEWNRINPRFPIA